MNEGQTVVPEPGAEPMEVPATVRIEVPEGALDAPPEDPRGPEPSGPADPPSWADYRATAVLMGAFVATMALAVAFARPFVAAELQAFKDPDAVGNSLGYIVVLLLFTALLLWIAKKGKKWMIQAIILLAVGSTIMYVVAPLLLDLGLVAVSAWGIGAVLGLVSVYALYKYPEWYVIDAVGILVAAGAASIFGISLGVVPVMVLLAGLAVYDAIAVYKTKHMLDLADTVIDLRLPILLVVPKHRGYSFLREAAKFKEAGPENKDEREAFFLGLGDLVMPTILVVSAMVFPVADGIAPILGAAIGTLVGFSVLMGYVLKGNPQAGLPLLNGGAIVGFLAGVYQATGSLVFW